MIADKLLEEPREGSGGRVASARLEYQLDVALCLLLDAHRTGDDYLLLLEYHDDVVICDSSTTPGTAHFYQVKTKKSGYWTKGELTQARGRPGLPSPNSYLGKLYHHRVVFGEGCASLTFLSNCPFKLRLTGDRRAQVYPQVACTDLHVEETSFLVDKLKTELELADVPDLGQLTKLEQSVLDLRAHSEQARAQLVTFLEECSPSQSLQPSLVFRSLKGELRRRNDAEAVTTDFGGLATAKGLSRQAFQAMVDIYLATGNPEDRWRSIRTSLENAGFPFGKIQTLRSAYIALDAALLDPSNFVLEECHEAAKTAVSALPPSTTDPAEVFASIVESIARTTESHLVDRATQEALALRVMYP